MSDKLSRLLKSLDSVGVKYGDRNKKVADATGYSIGSVKRILSGNTPLTHNFLVSVCHCFGLDYTEIEINFINIEPNCNRCRFYYSEDNVVGFGQCRKNAPVITEDSNGAFPRIRNSDWCGEFKPTR